jgi:hypothetical protein
LFIGHFGIAMAAKRVAPRTSLGTLIVAAQFADLLWPVFLILGYEQVAISPGATAVTPLDFVSYPFSHSLLADLGWAFLFAGIYRILRRDSAGAICCWFLVMSHWVLDVVTHRPDLQLYPSSPVYFGLGLWNSRLLTLVAEFALLLFGARIYSRRMPPRDGIGKWGFRVFLAVLAAVYLANVFGPPPPNEKVLAYSAFGIWLFVAWAAWFDRHRTFSLTKPPTPPVQPSMELPLVP